jgi:hypothetical protein
MQSSATRVERSEIPQGGESKTWSREADIQDSGFSAPLREGKWREATSRMAGSAPMIFRGRSNVRKGIEGLCILLPPASCCILNLAVSCIMYPREARGKLCILYLAS